MTESQLQQEIRLALGRLPDLVLWRNSAGVASTANGSKQRFGLVRGAADLIGMLTHTCPTTSKLCARFIALEIKTPVGRLSSEQKLFLNLVRSRGGFAAVVRSPDEAIQAIARAREGAHE